MPAGGRARRRDRLRDTLSGLDLVPEEVLDACEAEQQQDREAGRECGNLLHILLRRGELTVSKLRELLERNREVAPPESKNARTLGRYRLVREIGQGGMGIIYEAHDPRLQRSVALKVLTVPMAGEEAFARFHREGAIAASLSHSAIIPVHDVGAALDPSSGQPVHYFTMDLVDGEDLADALPRLNRQERLRVLTQVAQGVAHAHERGIVHRDLKPANVLLSAEGQAVVTDFGLARSLEEDSRLTRSGTVLGTAEYMAPEQAAGQLPRVGPPADVWSLGVILYEMLTDRVPFEGDAPTEVLMGIIHRDPRPPRQYDRGIPVELEAICLQALQKEPEDRYPDAGAFAADLERFQQGLPVQARRQGPLRRLRRYIQRRRAVVSAAVVGAGVMFSVGLSLLHHGLSLSRQAALAQEVEVQVRDRLEGLVEPATSTLRMIRRFTEANPELLHRAPYRSATLGDDRLALLLASVLEDWDKLSWASFSSPEGDFVGAYRVPEAPEVWINKSYVLPEGEGQAHEFGKVGESFQPTANAPHQPPPGYDPRTRPFYALATSRPGLVWTPPYVFWGGYPGITGTTALRSEGQLLGVLTVDFELWQLSRELRGVQVGLQREAFHGEVVLLTPEGKMVAHSRERIVKAPYDLTHDRNGERGLLDCHQVEDPILCSLLEQYPSAGVLQPTTSRGLAFQHDDRTWRAHVRRMRVAGLELMAIMLEDTTNPQVRHRYAGSIRVAAWSSWGLVLFFLLYATCDVCFGRKRPDSWQPRLA